MTSTSSVVGAGTSGCIVASRLSEDPRIRVLLVEAGGSDRNPIITMPGALPFVYQNKRIGWGYQCGPEPFAHGKTVDEKAGRVGGHLQPPGAVTFGAIWRCFVIDKWRAEPRSEAWPNPFRLVFLAIRDGKASRHRVRWEPWTGRFGVGKLTSDLSHNLLGGTWPSRPAVGAGNESSEFLSSCPESKVGRSPTCPNGDRSVLEPLPCLVCPRRVHLAKLRIRQNL
nr:GMC family oxidoreductase N-terminal domain-containing protein [Arthrobacter sp. AZCC_0090]